MLAGGSSRVESFQRGQDRIDVFTNPFRRGRGVARWPKLARVIDKGGDPAKLAEIDRLMDEMRASGFIKASLDRAKISGVDVAPPAKR